MIVHTIPRILTLAMLTWFSVASAQALDPTALSAPGTESVELHSGSFDGYNLISPLDSTITFLVDNLGNVVNRWQCGGRPALSAYLLNDGQLLRTCKTKSPTERFQTGGAGGRIEKFDWDGNLIWEYEYASDKTIQHHDIEPLPNGNVLLIAWEHFSAEQAISAGRDPRLVGEDGVWVDQIVELKPSGKCDGEIVWRWRLWDHLIQDIDPSKKNYGDVANQIKKLDFNYTVRRGDRAAQPDWTHFNSIDYHSGLDQILVSCHGTSEFFVIDHSTTIVQAANGIGGRSDCGGGLLYRWGNPASYRAGLSDERQLFAQHDARWIEEGCPGAGNILFFNNGLGRPDGRFSSVEEIQPPLARDFGSQYRIGDRGAYGPKFPQWSYIAEEPANFFSAHISGSQRLPNGNTLVCCGAQGWFFEVSQTGKIVWEMMYLKHSSSAQRDQSPFVLCSQDTHATPAIEKSTHPAPTPKFNNMNTSDREFRPDVFRITRYPKTYFTFLIQP